MPQTTLQNFGIPLGGGAGRGGILMPKTKHRFRVRAVNFGPVNGGVELTQQVVSCGRPTVNSSPVEVHSYNSIAYYAGKAVWNSISLVARDDVTNSLSRLVAYQEQKQLNHIAQTSFLSGSNYKFTLYIETLDGGDDGVLETWFIEGCFLEGIEWDQFEYSTAEPMQITMTIRYDNATYDQMPATPAPSGSGPMMT
jgi:hypothetical protein